MYYLKKYIFGKGFQFAWSYGKKLQPPAYVLPSLKWFNRLLAFSKQCVEMHYCWILAWAWGVL